MQILLLRCFGESSNSNKTVTQLNATKERRSLGPPSYDA